MRHTGRDTAPAAPKGAAFSRDELALLDALPVAARRAALKVMTFAWLDEHDDDSFGSALVAIGEKPSDFMGHWHEFKDCVRLLRRGPNSA